MKKLLALCLLLIFFGCGPDHEISQGVVQDMKYRPDYQEWHDGYYSNGACIYRDVKSQVCYVYSQHWNPGHYEYHPPDYDILIRGEKEDGTLKEEWFDVDGIVYGACSVGQYYDGNTCESGRR